jgi:hypothetical protein
MLDPTRRNLAVPAAPAATRRDFVLCLSALSLAGLARPLAADPDHEVAATRAALTWLELVDAGRHDQSWEEAAPGFKEAVSRLKWDRALRAVRTPLGRCRARKLRSRKLVDALPGAPRGPYVVIEFDTAFERQPEAVETITPGRGEDGRWRVAGYFIR